jgi:hypothetical protein
MRWENEGGAVLLRPTGTSAPTRTSKARRLQKESANQAPDGRQAVGDGAARGRPGASLGQRKILPFELLA